MDIGDKRRVSFAESQLVAPTAQSDRLGMEMGLAEQSNQFSASSPEWSHPKMMMCPGLDKMEALVVGDMGETGMDAQQLASGHSILLQLSARPGLPRSVVRSNSPQQQQQSLPFRPGGRGAKQLSKALELSPQQEEDNGQALQLVVCYDQEFLCYAKAIVIS